MRELVEPVDLRKLIAVFYEPVDLLGEFRPCASATELPHVASKLLNHHGHMTVTVESFYGVSVDVRVARRCFSKSSEQYGSSGGHNISLEAEFVPQEDWYAREITLHRHTDQVPVQYGIVRLRYDLLAEDVWNEIRSEKVPLGRALIEHNVLREVELCGLWEVRCGPPMARLLNLQPGNVVYGRTARIFCDHLPAIELLEVVSSPP